MVARETALDVVRRSALVLPEATERLSHGAPAFFVGTAPQFASFVDGDYYTRGGDFGIWCAAPQGAQDELVDTEPDRFFVPPYVGGRGWVGLRLDAGLDQPELAAILRDAYRAVAPPRLRALLDESAPPA